MSRLSFWGLVPPGFPVSAFFEAILGYNLDYKSNADMGLAIGLCAALVYLLGAGLGFLYSRISS